MRKDSLGSIHRALCLALGFYALALSSRPLYAYQCAYADGSLSSQSPSLAWMAKDIQMLVSNEGADAIDAGQLLESSIRSLTTWDEVPCSYLGLELAGVSDSSQIGYQWLLSEGRMKNENLILFRENLDGTLQDEWLHDANNYAVTTLTFVRSTGEILDADIEINSYIHEFADCGEAHPGTCPASVADLENMLTHEVGHVLGLDHPLGGSGDTTMFASAQSNETKKRSLEQDDKDGLCAIYPRERGEPDLCPGAGPRLELAGSSQFEDGRVFRVAEEQGCSQSRGQCLWFLALVFAIARLLHRGTRFTFHNA